MLKPKQKYALYSLFIKCIIRRSINFTLYIYTFMFYLSQFQMKHQGKKLVTEVRKQVDKRKVCSHSINKAAIFYFTTISMTTVGSIMVVAHECLYCIQKSIYWLRFKILFKKNQFKYVFCLILINEYSVLYFVICLI
jgi:hypothetical protein